MQRTCRPLVAAFLYGLAGLAAPATAGGGVAPADRTAAGRWLSDPEAPSAVLLRREQHWQLAPNDRDGRLDGSSRTIECWLVVDEAGADALSTLAFESGPLIELTSLEVEVHPAGGGAPAVLAREDLRWFELPAHEGLVISADRSRSLARVPGVQPGSIVVQKHEQRLRDLHGIPRLGLAGRAGAWERAVVALDLPAGSELRTRFSLLEESQGELVRSREEGPIHDRHRWELGPGRADPGEGPWLLAQLLSVPGHPPGTALAVAQDWPEVGRLFRSRVDSACAPTPELLQVARDLAPEGATPHELLEAVGRYLDDGFHYLGFYDEFTGIFPPPAGEVLAAGFGDCKGLSALMVALLRARGLPAELVLLRAGPGPPPEPELPNLTQFNHCIVWADVGDGGLYVDPTAPGTPVGCLPPGDLYGPVLTLDARQPRFGWPYGGQLEAGVFDLVVAGQVDSTGRLDLEIGLSRRCATPIGTWRDVLRSGGGRSASPIEALFVESLGPFLAEPRPAAPGSTAVALRLERPLPGGGKRIYLPTALLVLSQPPPPGGVDGREHAVEWPGLVERWRLRLPPGRWQLDAEQIEVVSGPASWRRRAALVGGELHLEREVRWRGPDLATVDPAAALAVLEAAAELESRPLRLRLVEGR